MVLYSISAPARPSMTFALSWACLKYCEFVACVVCPWDCSSLSLTHTLSLSLSLSLLSLESLPKSKIFFCYENKESGCIFHPFDHSNKSTVENGQKSFTFPGYPWSTFNKSHFLSFFTSSLNGCKESQIECRPECRTECENKMSPRVSPKMTI